MWTSRTSTRICKKGGTRCSGRVSVPCLTSDTCHKLYNSKSVANVKISMKYLAVKGHRHGQIRYVECGCKWAHTAMR